MRKKDEWQIVSSPGKPGYYSLVRGYGNETEWLLDKGSINHASFAFFELAEEKRRELQS